MKLDQYTINGRINNKIKQSITIGNLDIVLLDTSGLYPSREGFKNLLAIDQLDHIVWVAELPVDYLYSSYQSIELKNEELFALSGSFLCKVDRETGHILSEKFVK